jgi:hypothetical protein
VIRELDWTALAEILAWLLNDHEERDFTYGYSGESTAMTAVDELVSVFESEPELFERHRAGIEALLAA